MGTWRSATETVLSVLSENFQPKIENLNFFKMCHNFVYSSILTLRGSGQPKSGFVIIIISNHDQTSFLSLWWGWHLKPQLSPWTLIMIGTSVGFPWSHDRYRFNKNFRKNSHSKNTARMTVILTQTEQFEGCKTCLQTLLRFWNFTGASNKVLKLQNCSESLSFWQYFSNVNFFENSC